MLSLSLSYTYSYYDISTTWWEAQAEHSWFCAQHRLVAETPIEHYVIP